VLHGVLYPEAHKNGLKKKKSKVNKFDSAQNRFFLGKWTLESFSGGLKTSKIDLAGLFPWFSGWNDFLG